MKGLSITLNVDGKETVLEVNHHWSVEVRTTDPEPTDDNWRVISLWGMDDRDEGLANDPTVCFSIGQEEPQITAYPVNNHPNRKTGHDGKPVWWEYDL